MRTKQIEDLLARENIEKDPVLGKALTTSLEIPFGAIAEHPKVKELNEAVSTVQEVKTWF